MSILAGDIGGTKTHLALFSEKNNRPFCIKEQKYPSPKHSNLEEIIRAFLEGSEERVEKACFGVAGPVKKGVSQATNLPWIVNAQNLAKELKTEKVFLINDLEANAYGLYLLEEDEYEILNKGDPDLKGNQAIISAGTGLGEAVIYFDGKNYHPFACEGGHCDFAPRNEEQDDLLKHLRQRFPHVSYERVLSGPGLHNIYRFLIDTKREKEDPAIFQEIEMGKSPELISEKGVKKESKACIHALELFSSIYGAEAGNHALKTLAFGGVFLGGGIAPKIASILKGELFMNAFRSKGRFFKLLSDISVRVILNPKTALLGAMYYAKKNT